MNDNDNDDGNKMKNRQNRTAALNKVKTWQITIDMDTSDN